MSAIEELVTLVSERLHAATSEILVAITKTVKNYEKEVSRLQEENERHRSVLDIIIKTQSSQTKASDTNRPAASATNPPTSDSRVKQKTVQTVVTYSIALPSVFSTRDEFLKLAGNGNCPFCFKRVQGTEQHLVKRHYLSAVHFIRDGNTKFVIPCMCKERIQDRSHWHCPLCKKIIYRRASFDIHLSKQHKIALVKPCCDADTNQPSFSDLKAETPLFPKPLLKQAISSLEQQENQASLHLPVKIDPEQDTPLQVQYDQRDLIQNGNDQMTEQRFELNQNHDSGLNIVCIDAYIQDISEICIRESVRNFSNQVPDRKPDTQTEMSDLTEVNQHSTGRSTAEQTGSCSKTEESNMARMTSPLKKRDQKKKDSVKRSLTLTNVCTKRARLQLASQKTTGFCCKVCGKKFQYMYTLRTHVRTHVHDKTCICGICGKHLANTGSLLQHVQSHNKRKVCGICGKEFSSDSLLKRHKQFHLPKGLNR